MKSNRWMLIGASVALAGVLMLGAAYATSGVVQAGNQVPCDATPTQTELDTIQGQRDVLAAAVQVRATCTPVRKPRTHTPTLTPTEEPRTATPVPPTAAPPTPKPSSGNEGVTVKPPNTGSGGGVGSDANLWLLVFGAAFVAVGGGAIFVGTRRR